MSVLGTGSDMPLNGVQVLEVGTGLGLAYAGNVLNELGATVVKIGGATAATEPGAALRARAVQAALDADKQVVEMDLDSTEFCQLLGQSDVALWGQDPAGPDVAAECRAQYAAWRAVSADLIFVALTPFGTSGPASGWAGGDLNAQSISGWVSIIGHPDAPPLHMNYGIGAMQLGLAATGAVLTALLAGGGERRGEFIDVAESDVIAASIRMYALMYKWSRIPLVRSGLRAPGSSGRYPHTILPCKDGAVVIICRSEEEWDRLLGLLGDPAWGNNPRYRDFYAMATAYPDEVDALLKPELARYTKEELWGMASRARVPLAPVRTADEVLADPQLEHRQFFKEVEVDGARLRVPTLPVVWSTSP